MSELEKLEFIHSTLQEVLQSEYKDMIETSIEFVEEIREKYYETNWGYQPIKSWRNTQTRV